MFRRWIAKYANERLQEQVDGLTAELATAKATMAIQLAELQAMAGVIARDRERVKAELAAYARQRAECEGTNGRT
ncbi:MAG: hypothetical protein JNL18_10375 [Planctomycetaceae bacterium]|uniref:Uncharacterized protein n=1 Tax=Lacipirellula limnantheis TaxID=2528024 RepID=A0A517TV12_9BACT|nr:hypothetical protein [Lacipirellula limnantheis]MBL9163129.1 hypothetical protein [Planctomycetaceae bacterium]QDT72212.1 hypothetical protein I41_13820 [Lacipirellula limnantheis]